MAANPDLMATPDSGGLAAAVEALGPLLAAGIEQAETERRLPAASVRAMADAGLVRAFRPRSHGGHGLHMRDVLPVVSAVARTCPASAWVLAVYQIHEWILGFFPDAVQAQVFADGRPVGGVLQPRGAVSPAGGGWALAPASWPFASGIDHAGWALVGALEFRDGGPPVSRLVLLAPGEYGILDDWQVSGLRGTGSRSIAVTGALTVPAGRVLDFADLIDGSAAAGLPPALRAAFVPVLSLNVTGPALGAARSALAAFVEHLEGRSMPFSPQAQADHATTWHALASARTRVDVAELLLTRAAQDVAEAAEAGEAMPLEARCRVRADCAWAVRECVTAVESLWRLGGGGLLQAGHRLNRLMRDVQAMQQHAALNLDNNLQLYGAATLGRPLNSAFV